MRYEDARIERSESLFLADGVHNAFLTCVDNIKACDSVVLMLTFDTIHSFRHPHCGCVRISIL